VGRTLSQNRGDRRAGRRGVVQEHIATEGVPLKNGVGIIYRAGNCAAGSTVIVTVAIALCKVVFKSR